MDTNTRNNNTSSSELVHIGNIGFVFDVDKSLKYNLISPEVLAFFDGVPESEEVTESCAFPPAIPNTNLRYSIFQNVGEDWAVCSDGVFRKCAIVECEVRQDDTAMIITFHVDCSLNNKDINIMGVISKLI